MEKKLILVLILALVLSNLTWARAYRKLWYDAAQAEGLLDEAQHYLGICDLSRK